MSQGAYVDSRMKFETEAPEREERVWRRERE
jgi:hypothetical protein